MSLLWKIVDCLTEGKTPRTRDRRPCLRCRCVIEAPEITADHDMEPPWCRCGWRPTSIDDYDRWLYKSRLVEVCNRCNNFINPVSPNHPICRCDLNVRDETTSPNQRKISIVTRETNE